MPQLGYPLKNNMERLARLFSGLTFLALVIACGDSTATDDADGDGDGKGGNAPAVMTNAEAIAKGCNTFGSTAAIRTAAATAEAAQNVGVDVLYLVTVPAGGGYLRFDTQHKGPYAVFLTAGAITSASLAGPGEPPTLDALCGKSPACGCRADAGYRVDLREGSFTLFLASDAGGDVSLSLHDLTKAP